MCMWMLCHKETQIASTPGESSIYTSGVNTFRSQTSCFAIALSTSSPKPRAIESPLPDLIENFKLKAPRATIKLVRTRLQDTLAGAQGYPVSRIRGDSMRSKNLATCACSILDYQPVDLERFAETVYQLRHIKTLLSNAQIPKIQPPLTSPQRTITVKHE